MNHYAGYYYHVFNRGVDKRNIFTNAENYDFLLRKFKANLLKFSVTVIAYCLMPNHYHLLLQPDLDGVFSQFIQTVFNGNEYFLHIPRYIHLNPVKAGLVVKPEDWPSSNYLECIGLRKGSLFSPEFITDNFGSPQNYQAFVEEQIPQKAEIYLQSLRLDK